MEIRIKLKEILSERGMTQRDLAAKTGLRPNAISEMVNNQRTTINREHAAIIANALEITDLNILFEITNR